MHVSLLQKGEREERTLHALQHKTLQNGMAGIPRQPAPHLGPLLPAVPTAGPFTAPSLA
jgi:hypothetical protein